MRTRGDQQQRVVGAVLAAALAGAVLAGCTGDEPAAGPATGAATSAPAPAPTVLGEGARLDALETALDAEHAAIHVYGLAAGRLRGADLALARAELGTHREQRDALAALLVDADVAPPAASPTYPVPGPSGSGTRAAPRDAAAARLVLAAVESSLAEAYRPLTAAADAATRTLATGAVAHAESTSVRWSGSPTPGSPTATRTTP